MKITQQISNWFLFLLLAVLMSCDLNEEPIFLDPSIYNSVSTAESARDGFYEGLADYDAQERRYFVANGFSGMFGTARNGNFVDNLHNSRLFSLKPVQDEDSELMWGRLYTTISRTNAAIENIMTVENPTSSKEVALNDVAGHAYFVRAWTYYYLVRLFGEIPLWVNLPSNTNFAVPTSKEIDIYQQIISDAKMAQNLMNGNSGLGYPTQHAANMLLAKVYMTIATNDLLKSNGLSERDYWQMAHDEAIKVYGASGPKGPYGLISDYGALFSSLEEENTIESIFELQISEAANNSQMGRNYTPFAYKLGQHYGWLVTMASVYDYHKATYPGDKRISGTYLSQYINAVNGKTVRVYPNSPRTNKNKPWYKWRNGHPYFYKFVEKNKQHQNQYNDQNIIIYRYADLLLMLAEISNELDKDADKMMYLEEVLDRAGVAARAEYSQGKEAFRDAIMDEYKFELLGEGEDFHNNRRRGFQYFLNNTIKRHNDLIGTAHYEEDFDLILSEDESQVMKLPIPMTEINTNEFID